MAFQEIACTPPSKDGFPAPPVCNTEYKSLPNKNIASVLIGGGGPENRYNYNNLEAAQQQCNAMDNCSGITRDGYGYTLRSGGPSPWPGMSSWQKERYVLLHLDHHQKALVKMAILQVNQKWVLGII